MAEKARPYRKLPGRGGRHGCLSLIIWTRASLWMGSDHLLSVLNTGYSEEYRRFFYRDIQAIAVTQTKRGRNQVIGLLAVGLLFFFLSMAVPASAMPFFWVLAGLPVVLALVNWLRGPTCRTFLLTAVSREELLSLGRIRAAEKALDILKPVIEKAQGRLSSADLAGMSESAVRQETLLPEPAFAPQRQAAGQKTLSAKPAAHYNGRWHEIVFTLLLLSGLLDIGLLLVRNLALSLVSTLLLWAATIVSIVALVKQHESAMRGWLRAAPAVTLGYLWVAYIAGFIMQMAVIVTDPSLQRNQFRLFKALSEISPADHPVLLGFSIFSMVFSFAVGTSGLILVHGYRQRAAAVAQQDGKRA